jgi:hypothetical protein
VLYQRLLLLLRKIMQRIFCIQSGTIASSLLRRKGSVFRTQGKLDRLKRFPILCLLSFGKQVKMQ